jgi:hypothetical protein
MPSRKSNVSAVSNAEEVVESTPVRAAKDKDGVSVDVNAHAPCSPDAVTNQRRSGPQPSEVDDRSPVQGRLAPKHANSQGRLVGTT